QHRVASLGAPADLVGLQFHAAGAGDMLLSIERYDLDEILDQIRSMGNADDAVRNGKVAAHHVPPDPNVLRCQLHRAAAGGVDPEERTNRQHTRHSSAS